MAVLADVTFICICVICFNSFELLLAFLKVVRWQHFSLPPETCFFIHLQCYILRYQIREMGDPVSKKVVYVFSLSLEDHNVPG